MIDFSLLEKIMTWQGIPFPIDAEKIVTSARFAIDRIPKIAIDTGDNTWALVIAAAATILGSIIAGLIPAWISWKTIKNNRYQMESEMRAQQATFDRSIETQLRIAESSFNAQVLSANRQSWINDLRENSSEFVSRLNTMLLLHEEYFIIKSQLPSSSRKQTEKNEIKQIKEKLMIHIPLLTLVSVKIELMLNTNEQISLDLIRCISELRNLSDLVAHDPLIKHIKEIESGLSLFKRLVGDILKNEWLRVKQGI